MLKLTNPAQEETLYSADDIMKEVRLLVSAHGSQKLAAEALGISAAYLSDLMRGRRSISDEFAAKMGYEPSNWWRKKEGEK